MQRLEVSDAVRPIYGSLGVKRLSSLCPAGTSCYTSTDLCKERKLTSTVLPMYIGPLTSVHCVGAECLFSFVRTQLGAQV